MQDSYQNTIKIKKEILENNFFQRKVKLITDQK